MKPVTTRGVVTPSTKVSQPQRKRADSAPGQTDREKIGALLRQLRAEQQPPMTQADLAKLVGRNRTLIALIEKGERTLNQKMAETIVERLELSPERARQFLATVGFPLSPIAEPLRNLVNAIMQTDPSNTMLAEIVRADLLTLALAWSQLVRSATSLRVGKGVEQRQRELRAVIENPALSPLSRLYARRKLAETLRWSRHLEEALAVLGEALEPAHHGPETLHRTDDLKAVRENLPQHGDLMRALLLAQQGEIFLRDKHFLEAQALFQDSETGYAALKAGILSSDASQDTWAFDERLADSRETAREVPKETADAITDIGLGRTAQRLAEAAMWLEDDQKAMEYCEKAMKYLAGLPPSPQSIEALRRINELRAWRQAREGHYAEAAELHQKAQQEAERAQDKIDQMKNYLYESDDWMHLIAATVEDLCEQAADVDDSTCLLSPGDAWREAVAQAPQLAEYLEKAEAAVVRAIHLHVQRDFNHPLSYGHCLRNVATVHRLRGEYEKARELLARAERHEEYFQLVERKPGIYEERANLYWDEGSLKVAEDWYQKALKGVEATHEAWTSRTNMRSRVLSVHADRMRAKLARLQRAIQSSQGVTREQPLVTLPARNGGHASPVDDATSQAGLRDIQSLINELERVVVDEFSHKPQFPLTADVHSILWLQELANFEELPGTRILAQDWLSLSLAPSPPARLLERGGASVVTRDHIRQVFKRRRAAFLACVESAGPGDHMGINRDLCARRTIEQLLAKTATMKLSDTRAQLEEAQRLMRQERCGYYLRPIALDLPFGFAVKGNRTLLEIPLDFARARLNLESDHTQPGDTELGGDKPLCCYRIDDTSDTNLAVKLTRIFNELYDTSSLRASDVNPTDWILRILQQPPEQAEEAKGSL